MFQPRLCTFTLCEDPARASSISTVPCEPGGLRQSTASPHWGEGRDPLQRARLPPGSLEGGLLGFSCFVFFFGPLLPGTELVFWDWAPGGVKQRHVAVLGIRSPCLQLYFRAAASGRCTISQLSSPPPTPRAARRCHLTAPRSLHPPTPLLLLLHLLPAPPLAAAASPAPDPFVPPSTPQKTPPRLLFGSPQPQTRPGCARRAGPGGSPRRGRPRPSEGRAGPGRAHPRRPCRSPGAAAGARGLPPARGAAER